MRRLLASPDAETRRQHALAWLLSWPADTEVRVVTPVPDAGHDLCREPALGARFGLERIALHRLALELAQPALVQQGRVPATRLSLTALVARVAHRLKAAGALGHFGPVATFPGFAPALLESLHDLRMAGLQPEALYPDLALFMRHLDLDLRQHGLADEAMVYGLAAQAVAEPMPLLLFDLQVHTAAEAGLVAALAAQAPAVLATAAAGDDQSVERLEGALSVACERLPGGRESLGALQVHLFETTQPPETALDDSVSLVSWPGEARECLEMVRRIQQAAAGGLAFDRMAVLLHSPGPYAAHLEEAFMRSGIPAWFTQGTRRPHPAGRALLALLHCVDEGLSATRMAEYLSLAQVPVAAESHWVPPDHDLLPRQEDRPEDPAYLELLGQPVSPSAVAPWRWEAILNDASVIGRDRWRRRLAGYDEEMKLQWASLVAEHPEKAEAVARRRQDLAHLQAFVLPLVDDLAALPRQANWDTWLAALRALAPRVLKDADPVLRKLEELAPMGAVGPVALDEVLLVLGSELRDVTVRPTGRRYGAVYVAPAEEIRGMAFDLVLVPGLAEKLFPHKIIEDPILPDTARRALDRGLVTQAVRVARERLSLRLAVGAARQSLVLSYPRLDVQQARPRVPSFYSLEVMRAATGRLPGYEELQKQALGQRGGRLGWPAPERPADAIDEAEYDLALLAPLLSADPATVAGTANYLVRSSPHLAGALRSRYARAREGWSPYDGLMNAGAALSRHQPDARSFSPTSLENYAQCPYKFFLNAIMRLTPREVPVPIEHMDPLTRGSLVHDVQFDILTRLRAEGGLPVTAEGLAAACELADRLLDARATEYAEKLCPSIERVWEDAVNLIRSDIRQWLRRMVDDAWVPRMFELSFGLSDRARGREDPASVSPPVALAVGLQVRGSIDLVEQHPDGRWRATDYKTGKPKAQEGSIVQHGEILQPLVYAMVLEKLLGPQVEGGRLYYCTTDGAFRTVNFPLSSEGRASLQLVVDIVKESLSKGTLLASPRREACLWCDYKPVCGPGEEVRTRRKPALPRLADLRELT